MKPLLILLLGVLLISLTSAYEKETCESLYFKIVEFDYSLNESWVSENYNISNFSRFIEEYPVECQLTYDLPKLPEKKEIPVIIIYRNQSECDSNIPSFFDWTFPPKFTTFKIGLGEIDCKWVNRLKWFINLEKSNSYSFLGIRFYILLILGISILAYTSSVPYLKRKIENYKNKGGL